MRYYLAIVRIVIIKGTKDKYWQGCGESGTLHTTGRNTNWCRNPTSGYLSKKVEIKISK